MKRFSLIAMFVLIVLMISGTVFPQDSPAENIVNGAYWKHKVSQFRSLPNPKDEICFLGDSITDGSEWIELTGCDRVTNRGISGDTSWGVMARIDEVIEGKPSKIFMLIGTNDLAWGGKTVTEVHAQIGKVIDRIQRESPDTEIYLQSVLPVVDSMREDEFDNKDIDAINPLLEKLASEKKITWVDIATTMKDKNGQLKRELTEDGLHLRGEAYYLWWSVIRKYFDN